ncbi:hypothetical protein Lal_00030770 [Lupinus albus]|uniref:Uncharacterized protein n=1 Tax=Lupinus albus TaxID=3870 RepID=A0A6A4PA49_LUPAL|nr:hypothetical protein Lalb_Chr17g0342761 [Lupinus albus]KAF1863689.1 hypothetical protein Lal_00030770 [Lupinus albus]
MKMMMGGCDSEKSNTPRLPLLNLNPLPLHSPDRPGMKTPPLHTLVSIPFGWEEQPGKPKPCTQLVCFSNKQKCLELPPRLLINDAKQLPSPTTVLEGPHVDHNENDHIGNIIGGCHKKLRMTRVKHSLTSSNLSHAKSCVWTSISEGLKQVVPWKSKKQKKDGYSVHRSKTFP